MHTAKQASPDNHSSRRGPCTASQIISWLLIVLMPAIVVLLLLGIAAMVLRKERQWIERGLVEEVRRGALSPQEFDLLRSAGRRISKTKLRIYKDPIDR